VNNTGNKKGSIYFIGDCVGHAAGRYKVANKKIWSPSGENTGP